MKRAFWAHALLVFWMGFLVLAVALPGTACQLNAQRPWLGRPIISDDGSTVIRLTGPLHVPGEIVDIGFFDAAGKQRAVVAGRHGLTDMAVSADGFVLVRGRIVGREGWFVSLYDPYGRLRWEISATSAGLLDVSLAGRRAAVEMREYRGPEKTSQYILLLNQAGSEMQRYSIARRDWFRHLSFCRSGSDLLVTTKSAILMFHADNLRLRWRAAEKTGVIPPSGVAMSPDRSKIAVLDGMRSRENGRTRLVWRVTLLDAKTGRISQQQTLPGRYRSLQEKPLRYDLGQQAFIVQTKEGQFRLTQAP